MIENARSRISFGSTSISGRGTEPARGMGTLEKSGFPPGRTAGSGTWRLSGALPVMSYPLLSALSLKWNPARDRAPRSYGDPALGEIVCGIVERGLRGRQRPDVAGGCAKLSKSGHVP